MEIAKSLQLAAALSAMWAYLISCWTSYLIDFIGSPIRLDRQPHSQLKEIMFLEVLLFTESLGKKIVTDKKKNIL